jgi:lysophospholipase L1-like esterase
VVGGGVKGATPLAVEGKPPDDGGARGRHRGRLPSWVVNLGLVLAAVAVTLGALEIALRVLGVQTASYHAIAGFTVSDPILGWKLAPSRETVFHGAHFAAHVSQNAEGLRDQHYSYEREAGRRRILVLGDSVVWCWGVEQDACFTERLEAALPDTDVINAGVPGYSTAQEMLFYEGEGQRYRPDLVLLVVVPNDLTDNLDPRGPRFRLVDGRLVVTNLPLERRKNVVGEWLQAHSRLFAHVSYLVAAANVSLGLGRAHARAERGAAAPVPTPGTAGQATPPPPSSLEPSAPVTGEARPLAEALMDRLATDVHRDGARLAVVLEVMDMRMKRWQLDFWAARGVPVLDLAPLLVGAERAGVRTRLDGDPHISPAGQELIAKGLQEFIGQHALLSASGTHAP